MEIYFVLVLIYGLLIGSFLNVCIYRIPAGISIVKPNSRCPKCESDLKALDLVPVFSYLLLGRKCRYCHDKISPRYMGVEILNAISYIGIFSVYGLSFEFISLCFLSSLLIVISFIDIDHMIIPNGLVLMAIGGGILVTIYHFIYSYSVYFTDGKFNGLIGMLTGSGTLLLLSIITIAIYKGDGGIGMGDVKILFPIGMFLGWQLTLLGLWLSAIIGGVIGIILISFFNFNRKSEMPFGPAISLGMYASAVYGEIIIEKLFT